LDAARIPLTPEPEERVDRLPLLVTSEAGCSEPTGEGLLSWRLGGRERGPANALVGWIRCSRVALPVFTHDSQCLGDTLLLSRPQFAAEVIDREDGGVEALLEQLEDIGEPPCPQFVQNGPHAQRLGFGAEQGVSQVLVTHKATLRETVLDSHFARYREQAAGIGFQCQAKPLDFQS
jgi:hypothetical protein